MKKGVVENESALSSPISVQERKLDEFFMFSFVVL